ncbi:hypothetical protein A3D11_02240 [Candidatus Peribacteria bacterium RIFCSPHIGHO2_02_FULL_49_16]|nr:MAG: hypothetical protein A2880_03700 [Candidatus Peribacteria bacterium RIFCSPHIGHO2_01_FULL_49_38]OGJ59946.1 MAG: hypothetical protein A3D11_02240 [Candidatus Peribacteria bacterium RIFCSPHIGHO2_02_FULL_49_16]
MTNNISPAQLEANRENAKLGGVKTERGKASIRFNARKHGILSNLISDYEKGVYEHYLNQVFEELRPETALEEILVERIAIYYLRLYRAGKAEKEYILSRLNPGEFDLDAVMESDKGYKPVLKFEYVERLYGVYNRYETSIENRLYKAMHELERIQRMRKGEVITAPLAVDVQHENGFVSQNAQ